MNEFQSGLLNELVAVKITTKEEFDKVINFLSINNCFLVNGEPVVKLTYPGDKAFVILKQDNAIFWQPANQELDERYKVVNVIEFFRPTEEEKVVEKVDESEKIHKIKIITITVIDKIESIMYNTDIQNKATK